MIISMFYGTSTPKGSYSAKTGVKLPYESKQSPLDGWMNQAYSRLSPTHGHITDCQSPLEKNVMVK